MLARKEAFTVLLSFFFFSIFLKNSAVTANDESRILTLRALVEKGTLAIDDYERGIDTAYVNGHYYSDKPVGYSLLAVPVYFVLYTFGISFQSHPSIAYATITSVTTCLSAAFLVLMFYKATKNFLKKKINRMLLTVSLVTTNILVFSSIFYSHVTTTLFLFSSFYLALLSKNTKRKSFLSGLLLGMAFLLEYPSVLVSIPIFLTVLAKKRKELPNFLLGIIPPFLLFLLFNYLITGNILDNAYFHTADYENSEWTEEHNKKFFEGAGISRMIEMLFSPFYGIFFFSPVLLFSVISLIYGLKSKEEFYLLFISVFLTTLIFFFGYRTFFGGAGFGNRYFLQIIPFTLLGSCFLIKKMREGRTIFISLVVLTLFISLFGALTEPNYIAFLIVKKSFQPPISGALQRISEGRFNINYAFLVLFIIALFHKRIDVSKFMNLIKKEQKCLFFSLFGVGAVLVLASNYKDMPPLITLMDSAILTEGGQPVFSSYWELFNPNQDKMYPEHCTVYLLQDKNVLFTKRMDYRGRVMMPVDFLIHHVAVNITEDDCMRGVNMKIECQTKKHSSSLSSPVQKCQLAKLLR